MSISAAKNSQSSSLLGDYFSFLKNPTYDSSPESASAIVSKIWRLYTGHIVLIMLIAFVIQFLSQWLISIDENKLSTLLESTPAYQFLLLAVVFAPVMEEIIFRLPLCFSRQNIMIPLVLIVVPVSSQIFQQMAGHKIAGLGLWILIGGFLYLLWSQILSRINRRTGEQFFARHLIKLVYGSAIVFGLLHIMNYPQQAWIAAPILVLPQVTLGLLLAYVRIKFGFLWAIFTHGLHNFLASSVVVLLALGSSELRRQILEQATDVELLPQDYVIQGVFVIWALGLAILILTTAVRLFQEWRQAKLQA